MSSIIFSRSSDVFQVRCVSLTPLCTSRPCAPEADTCITIMRTPTEELTKDVALRPNALIFNYASSQRGIRRTHGTTTARPLIPNEPPIVAAPSARLPLTGTRALPGTRGIGASVTDTEFAAIMGGLPIALGLGVGAELRQPLGVAVVGGRLAAQLLTLYIPPVIYLFLEDMRPNSSCSQRRGPSAVHLPAQAAE